MTEPDVAHTCNRLLTGEQVMSLRALFDIMYRHFENVAGRPMLRENGFETWLGMYDKLVGRSRMIVAAHVEGSPVGFIEGLIRSPAAYALPGLQGFVAHICVAPELRGTGVAHDLFAELLRWFQEKNTSAVELQVVYGNEPAMRFWQKQGFALDLSNMRLDT